MSIDLPKISAPSDLAWQARGLVGARAVSPDTLNASPVYLSSIGYSTGTPRSTAELLSSGAVSEDELKQLHSGGNVVFCESNGPARELYRASISETLSRAGCIMSDIRGIVLAQPSTSWSEDGYLQLMEALDDFGITSIPIHGVSLQGCGPLAGAIDAGTQAAQSLRGPILLIVSGVKDPSVPRYADALGAVFGDAVATVLLSTEQGAFRVLASATRSSPSLALSFRNPSGVEHLVARHQLISQTSKEALARAGCSAADMRWLFTTNGKVSTLEFAAAASGVERRKIWSAGQASLGHLFGCDSLVGLRNACDSHQVEAGDAALLIGWSPQTVSAVVVRVDEAA